MRRWRLTLIAAACTLVSGVAPSRAVVPDDQDLTRKVLACYRAIGNKVPTIQQMHDCSGLWVTPHALLMCAMQTTKCPVFSDALTDRGTFFGELQAQKLTITTPLLLPGGKEDLPPMPSRSRIDQCRQSEARNGEQAFKDCVLKAMLPPKFSGVLPCFQQLNDKDRAACFARQLNNETFTHMVDCIGENRPTPEKLTECIGKPLEPRLKSMRDCVSSAKTAEAARDCLTKDLDPPHQKLTQCLSGARTGNDAAACLDVVNEDYRKARQTVDCLRRAGSSLTTCSGQILSGPAKVAATCLAEAKDKNSQFACAATINPELARAKKLSDCVKDNLKGAALQSCVAPYLGGDGQKFVACVRSANANIPNCFGAINPGLKTAKDSLNCLSSVAGADQTFGCLAGQAGGEAARIAQCVKEPDRAKLAICLLGNKPEVRAAQAAYECVSKASDTASVIGYCAQAIPVDDKTREVLTCTARASGDRSKLLQCAGASVLPPQATRIISCATSSQGVTSFALCSASPAMNEEWRIVTECALQGGGNPISVAGCSAGRLTMRELTKCFTANDCFGPNNTIVKGLNDAFHDIAQGLGPNNEIRKALDSLKDLNGGQNSVINNPGQIWGGKNSIFNNPSQIWGGPNSVFNNPSQVWGGPNSIFNNPHQLLGGPNSLINNPGQVWGGENSAVRQFIEKPLGGDCSFFHRPAGC